MAFFALPFARLTSDRRQSGQTRGLLSLELPKFRHIDDERYAGYVADARYAAQDGKALRQASIHVSQCRQLSVDALQVIVNALEPRIELA